MSDAQALRTLLAHGYDAEGTIFLGGLARDRFVNAEDPTAISLDQKGEAYARLANEEASTGESWSSAAGGQPKFAAHSELKLKLELAAATRLSSSHYPKTTPRRGC